MATVIRLARFGTKKKPFYHIIVTDSRNPRDGKFIEKIGFYNPMPSKNGQRLPDHVVVDEQKLSSWTQKGALPSTTVQKVLNILKTQKKTEGNPEASLKAKKK